MSCGGLIADEDPRIFFCPDCTGDVADAASGRCRRCAAALGPADAHEGTCISCGSVPLAFDRAYTAGSYQGRLRELVVAFKFNGRAELAHALAQPVWERLQSKALPGRWDLLVAVPTGLLRTLVRGYSPVQLLCRDLEKLGAPPSVRALRLTRRLRPQRGLTRTARQKNVKGAFAVLKRATVSNKRILLVDDVMTTGATASECARTLRRAGARSVDVAVVAKTEHN